MGRRGSISFVIEIKRSKRRFPLALGRTDDPNGKAEVRFAAARPSGLAATPFSEGPKGYDPTVEAAKVAADRLFNKLSGSESSPVSAWNSERSADAAPQQQAAGIPAPAPARDVSATQSPAATPVAQPRTGRILESLTSANPLEALFRQKAEERAARHRRPRATRSTTVGESQTGVRPDSKQGSTSKSTTEPKSLLEAVVSTTDPKEPRRSQNKSRRKTAARRLAPERARKSGRKRKSAAKSRRPTASPVRTAKHRAGPKRNARNGAKASVVRKRGTTKKLGRKVLARKTAPNKGAMRKTVARNLAKASKLRKTSRKSVTSRGRAPTRRRRSR
jgi:ribonuclease E